MKKKKNENSSVKQNQGVNNDNSAKQALTKSLEQNIGLFKTLFKDDETLITRRFQSKYLPSAKCCILYFDGMINTELLNENVISPVLSDNLSKELSVGNLLEELQYKVIMANNVTASSDISKLADSIIYGDTLFLLEGYGAALIINSKGWKTRSISEPESSKVVRGPREGFTESILINLSMLRRKIKNPDLKIKFKEIGKRTHTKTCICYIEGLAREDILHELEQRLDRIEIDGILDSGYIQELIRDAPFSPFETVGSSERPDVIAAKLLEGRVALFVDGSPFVLTVPFIIVENAQSNEDYYGNFIYSTFNRFLRSVATVLSISIPALYLAIVTFHQEMLPTPLLLSISASEEGVPFPTVLSLFLMLLIFDILREAGTRMPSPIGHAINIVGTLVLGQAAVEARLVSAPVVIITALTGILTLLNFNMIGSVIILRFFLLIGAAFLGIYGLIFNFILILIHLMNIRSFGVPYLLNISALEFQNFKDVWIRAPWWTMKLRPRIIGARNLIRQSNKGNKVK